MKTLFTRKPWTILLLLLAVFLMAGSAGVSGASADSSFNLTVFHGINGRSLGLMDSDLPVNVFINGGLAIEDMRFGETVSTSLPAGNYKITVALTDGTPLPSMTVGPVYIPAGVDVDARARLDKDSTPVIVVKAAESPMAVSNGNMFDVTVRHSINGQRLGLLTNLPVNVYINGALAIPEFRLGDVVRTSLPAGTYTITVTLLDGTPLPTMTLGPVDIASGADLIINAKLDADKTPYLFVRSR